MWLTCPRKSLRFGCEGYESPILTLVWQGRWNRRSIAPRLFMRVLLCHLSLMQLHPKKHLVPLYPKSYLTLEVAKELQPLVKSFQSLQTLWLRVTTEVYYARAVDIAVQSKRAVGGAASVKPIVSPPASGDLSIPELIDPSLTPLQRAQQLNHSLAQASASTVPGGFFRFVTATDASVSMRRVWERDIAIGFRGLLLEVDKHTGVVMRAGTTFGVSPTLK